MSHAIPLIHEYPRASAARLPWKEALIAGNCRYTYRELHESATALARTLARHGVRRGDRVAILCENGHQAVIAFWAALEADAIVVPLDPESKSDELTVVLDDARPTALVSQAPLAPGFAWAARTSRHLRSIIVAGEVEADLGIADRKLLRWSDAIDERDSSAELHRNRAIDIDVAAIVYAQGATEPRGVMLTHRNVTSAVSSLTSHLSLSQDDVFFDALPLWLENGLTQMIAAFAVGARLVLGQGLLRAEGILESILAEAVSGLPGDPAMFASLVELTSPQALVLPSVRWLTSIGAPLSVAQARGLQATFPKARVYSVFGTDECNLCLCLPADDIERKPGSIGRALPNIEALVIDENGDAVPAGGTGRLVIRGGAVTSGYWGKPGLADAHLRPGRIGGERYLDTGERASMDSEGYVRTSGGSNAPSGHRLA